MERVLTVEQMRNADKFTIEKLGISQDDLVERAGKCVAEEIMKRFIGGRVLVCVGKGNNGADGKIVAEILSKLHGFSVNVLTVSNGILKLFEKKHDIIVDCIFGTGLNREVDGVYKEVIEKINESNAYVISCDIASGLNGDTGRVMGVAVKANLTVAIQEYKLGHFLNDGPYYSGEVIAKDIGISVWEDEFIKKFTAQDVARIFLKRKCNVNKGDFGKACVIGGSKKYTGSICLSALSLCALKVGAGYSYLVVPNSLFNAYVLKVPECILMTNDDCDGNLLFDQKMLDSIMNFNSISFGMGTGISEEIYKILKYLLENFERKLIIDADGLNTLAQYGVEILKDKKCQVVLTPHIGEFSRLCNESKENILKSPVFFAKRFAEEFDVTVLLKNAVSVITDGKEIYINTTGTPAMAKAGSGDVLSGVLCGVLARENETLPAVVSSAYLFGLAGEIAVKKSNEHCVIATEIINCIPESINSLFK